MAFMRAADRKQHLNSTQKEPKTQPSEDSATSSGLVHPANAKKLVQLATVAVARCNRCILQRQGCDGKKPRCERCTLRGEECEWYEEPISRPQLEKLVRMKSKDVENTEPGTRNHNGLRAEDGIASSSPARPKSQETGKDIVKIKRSPATTRRRNQGLEDIEEERLNRPLPGQVFDESHPKTREFDVAPELSRDQWTYEDHLNFLKTLSKVRVDPLTKEQVFGHKKGNKIFNDTTKVFEEYDQDEELDKNLTPLSKYEGLRLDWNEREFTFPPL